MSSKSNSQGQAGPAIPADDPRRELVAAEPDTRLQHIGVVGDTYTILLGGKDTAGRFRLIDMHVPPGGGSLHPASRRSVPVRSYDHVEAGFAAIGLPISANSSVRASYNT
jgi:hypothetical protein